MSATRESILDRVRKLLSLAANAAATPAEAALAAERASTLMMEHRIDALELEQAERDREDAIGRTQAVQSYTRNVTWRSMLFGAAGRAMGCRVVISHDGLNRVTYNIVGRASDRSAAVSLFEFLCSEVDRLAMKNAPEPGTIRCGIKEWLWSFRIGAVDVISTRLAEMSRSEDRKAQERGVEGLVRQERALIDRAVRAEFPSLRKGATIRVGGASGYGAGRAAGATVSLSSPQRRMHGGRMLPGA